MAYLGRFTVSTRFYLAFFLILLLTGGGASVAQVTDPSIRFDLNSSGRIDAGDLLDFFDDFLGDGTEGDFDGSGETDAADLFLFAEKWKQIARDPFDPRNFAPPLDPAGGDDFLAGIAFLYSGSPALQLDVAPGVFESTRAAVVKGRVLQSDGSPLSEVEVTIHKKGEFGKTYSRSDGRFDMVVNGGGRLCVCYVKDGFLQVHRDVIVPYRDFITLDDVCLTPLDPLVTAVDLSSGGPHMAEGSMVADDDGIRKACVLFPSGTQAEFVMQDGSRQPATDLSVRATEFTVGDMGPMAMPNVLPPLSAYTYCVEYSVDEAMAAGAVSVDFDRPLCHYNENFLGFPVGTAVPVGYYDREKAQWIASENGVVLGILAVDGALADIDLTGSGTPATPEELAAIGLTEEERTQLAGLYSPGQTLWRAPISHFTPWDHNWPFGPPDDAEPPPDIPRRGGPLEESCEGEGSIIELHNQILGESIPLAGVPFNLNYRSDRVVGYGADGGFRIPISGPAVPFSLSLIKVELEIAGQKTVQDFPPAPDQVFEFEWSGEDTYGRRLLGPQDYCLTVSFVYPAVYLAPATARIFGRLTATGAAIVGDRTRSEISLVRTSKSFIGREAYIGAVDARIQGMGGWTLDIHHFYDANSKTFIGGDGGRRRLNNLNDPNQVATFYKTPDPLDQFTSIATGPDGSVYVVDGINNHVIRRLSSSGESVVVAGTGSPGSFNGDGIPATEAYLNIVSDIELAPDGSLYILEQQTPRVRRVDPAGVITTVAGDGEQGFSGDGGPATLARFGYNVSGIDVAQDGTLYIVDPVNFRVRAVGTDGIITTVVGNGNFGAGGDGGPAIDAELGNISDVIADAVGGFYIPDSTTYLMLFSRPRVRYVNAQGIINTVAGANRVDFGNIGGYDNPSRGVLGPDGETLFMASIYGIYKLEPSGALVRVSGLRNATLDGNRISVADATFQNLRGLDIGPDGRIYLVEQLVGSHLEMGSKVRVIGDPFPDFSADNILIASEDGSELYEFDPNGKHLKTFDTLTNAVLYEFSYDANGWLVAIEDVNGNVTTIERGASGDLQAFVGPYGHRTEFTVRPDGYLASVAGPEAENYSFAYANSDGLLTGFTNPRGKTSTMTYDLKGQLVRDQDPGQGFLQLARTDMDDSFEVEVTTAEGESAGYGVTKNSDNVQVIQNRFPNGTETEAVLHNNGSRSITKPDGSTLNIVPFADPRWGLQSPYVRQLVVKPATGLTLTVNREVSTALSDSLDLFSLESQTETVSINGDDYVTTFDAQTKATTVTSPEGRTVSFVQDDRTNIVDTARGDLFPVHYSYNDRGELTSLEEGSGPTLRSAVFTYTDRGDLETIVDSLGRTSSFVSDGLDRYTDIAFPDGRTVQLGYDANSNVTRVTPPGRPEHRFVYDDRDLPIEYIPPNVGAGVNSTLYEYDLDGRLEREIRPDGRSIGYDYTAGTCNCGNLDSLTLSRGTIRFAYEEDTGRLASVSTPEGSVLTYEYKGDLPTLASWSGEVAGSVRVAYDNTLRIRSHQVNSGPSTVIGRTYNGDSQITQAGDLELFWQEETSLYAGSRLGSCTDIVTYNGFGELETYRSYFNGDEIYSSQYVRNAIGNIVQKSETIGGGTDVYEYEYEFGERLAEVRKNGVVAAAYAYDENENRLSYTAGLQVITAVHDAQDRLTQYGDATFAYTANGELSTKTDGGQVAAYAYDELGNLLSVTLPDGTLVEYVIDGHNRRIGKKIDGVLMQGFLYQDNLNPIAVLDGAGDVLSRFVYASLGNVPDYMAREGITYRILSDRLGSPRLVIDANTGTVAQRIDYDEFGRVLADSNPGFQPFGFAGGIYDADTGLVRLGARDYDPEIGRWTLKDSSQFAGGFNLYAYASNDPINRIDLTGNGDGLWDGYDTAKSFEENLDNWYRQHLEAEAKAARAEAQKRAKEAAAKADAFARKKATKIYTELDRIRKSNKARRAAELAKKIAKKAGKLPGGGCFLALDFVIDPRVIEAMMGRGTCGEQGIKYDRQGNPCPGQGF
jgi:RHS repeat-associated protein